MRITKLFGLLLLISGIFISTRGTGWHAGYIGLGAFLAFVGALLLSRRRVDRLQVKPARRRAKPSIVARAGRDRLTSAVSKSAGR
jgi:hypothetical protein